MKTRSIASAATLTAVGALALTACGSSSGSGSSSAATSSSASSSATSGSTAAVPFGPGCAAVPKTGKGSFGGMTQDTVATAASNNPLLSTLVTAVKKAGLVDTLNNTQNLTVFAPTNAAFAKLPKATLAKVLADKTMLTKILTNHVLPTRLGPDKIVGTHPTLAKTSDTVSGTVPSLTVKGGATAKIICGNVQTANANVYIIDTVLVPAS
ncbi:fasciclin domain-containing protein [Allobranchiibius sp. CTAmp26]|uniref:fasciclin domain-containing protein n=1 Tax=Allobranchiibius sp. CTAmp26 TaxID=2815214 RepID=UPI001AA0C5A1|nr:fasciclin domain-containing protein [Allobranchiibius sp. CTAmp26]MBO1756361.1 fasciclin domain-containing protein [Allobranchiibius sp. CTAmp26]